MRERYADQFWGVVQGAGDVLDSGIYGNGRENVLLRRALFRSGEATHNFYTLIQGELDLYIGTNAQQIYTVNHEGDVFGWSSLVGGILYSATAVCSKPSELLVFDSDLLERLLMRYPESGLLFYKKLAETLGKRLLKAYQVIQSEVALVPELALDSSMLSISIEN